MSREAAIKAMDDFHKSFNVKPTSIGQLAVNNRNAYDRLVAGTAHHTTATAIIQWVADETERRNSVQDGAA